MLTTSLTFMSAWLPASRCHQVNVQSAVHSANPSPTRVGRKIPQMPSKPNPAFAIIIVFLFIIYLTL